MRAQRLRIRRPGELGRQVDEPTKLAARRLEPLARLVDHDDLGREHKEERRQSYELLESIACSPSSVRAGTMAVAAAIAATATMAASRRRRCPSRYGMARRIGSSIAVATSSARKGWSSATATRTPMATRTTRSMTRATSSRPTQRRGKARIQTEAHQNSNAANRKLVLPMTRAHPDSATPLTAAPAIRRSRVRRTWPRNVASSGFSASRDG